MKFNGKSVERIGLFTKTNGNKGDIEFSPDDNTRLFNKKEWIFVDIQQEIIPFFVKGIFPKGKKLIVSLKYITTQNQAENLTKKIVFISGGNNTNKNSSHFLNDFLGFSVSDIETNQKLGIFTSIIEEQANPLMKISGEKEILVPLNSNFIKEVNKSKKQIFLNLPEGFLEIY